MVKCEILKILLNTLHTSYFIAGRSPGNDIMHFGRQKVVVRAVSIFYESDLWVTTPNRVRLLALNVFISGPDAGLNPL